MYVQVLFNKILITRTSNKKINILWILKYVIEAEFVLGYSPRKYTTYYEKEKRKIRYRQIVQLWNSSVPYNAFTGSSSGTVLYHTRTVVTGIFVVV